MVFAFYVDPLVPNGVILAASSIGVHCLEQHKTLAAQLTPSGTDGSTIYVGVIPAASSIGVHCLEQHKTPAA